MRIVIFWDTSHIHPSVKPEHRDRLKFCKLDVKDFYMQGGFRDLVRGLFSLVGNSDLETALENICLEILGSQFVGTP